MGLRRPELRLPSVVGRGRAVSRLAGFQPFTPARVSSLIVGWEPDPAYWWQDSAGTTPWAADSDPVGLWTNRFGTSNPATQGTGAARFAGRTNPYRLTSGGAQSLTFTGVTLTGAFTAYAVGLRSAAGAIWIGFGGATNNFLGVYSDNNYYVLGAAVTLATGAYTGTNGAAIVFRARRTAGGDVFVRATGMAESAGNANATAPVYTEIGHRGVGEYTATGGDHRAGYLFSADLVATGEATAMEAYLAAQPWGATL